MTRYHDTLSSDDAAETAGKPGPKPYQVWKRSTTSPMSGINFKTVVSISCLLGAPFINHVRLSQRRYLNTSEGLISGVLYVECKASQL